MTVLQPFLGQCEIMPGRAALIAASGRVYSFADLDRWSRRIAAGCRLAGIGSGTRVLVAHGMTPRLYATLIALWRVGAVAVFPEPAAGIAGLRHAIKAAQPQAYAGPGWLALLGRFAVSGWPRRNVSTAKDEMEFLHKASAEHSALITFTSGSTGVPKGIVRSHGFLLAQQAALVPLLAQPENIDLISLPMFVLANLGFGVTSVIPDGKLKRPARMSRQRLVGQIMRHGVTRILAPPAICHILAQDRLPATIGHILTGGGPVFPDLARALIAAAPGARVTAVYGSTEAEPIAHVDLERIAPDDWAAMQGGAGLLAGQTVPEIRLRLIDDEIVVTGEHVNKGYLDPMADASTKLLLDGEIWHRTGDAGRLDAEGRLWLLGRIGQRIEGLFPFAVETAALSWPGVGQAALIEVNGKAVLAIVGNDANRPDWQACAVALGNITVKNLPNLPMDARHNSKIDYVMLRGMLAKAE